MHVFYARWITVVYTRQNSLAHYGIKGQKWGQRQWQNLDGSYTEAGKQHYGWGKDAITSNPPKGSITEYSPPRRPREAMYAAASRNSARANVQQKPKATPEQIAHRKAVAKKVLIGAAAVGVTAALAYGAYKGSTKLRDEQRAEVLRTINTDHSKINTLNSKYWTTSDRKEFTERSKEHAQFQANSITRRDAVAAKVAQKTGIRVNVPHSRKKVMAERREANQYANFIRGAENRADINRQIHDARQAVKQTQKMADRYKGTKHYGISKNYEAQWNRKNQEQVDAAKKRLEELMRRRAG
jgi:hypothetical protein